LGVQGIHVTAMDLMTETIVTQGQNLALNTRKLVMMMMMIITLALTGRQGLQDLL
jgi:hypothetical protein